MLKHKDNKWWNTIWTERDQEFFWSGAKEGFVGGILVSIAVVGLGVTIYEAVNYIKEELSTKEES